jgi:hypothetical protein
MDYSKITTLEQAIQIIKDLEKLAQSQHDYIEELEDNNNTFVIKDLQDNNRMLEKEVDQFEDLFYTIGLTTRHIEIMSVYDAMKFEEFVKWF